MEFSDEMFNEGNFKIIKKTLLKNKYPVDFINKHNDEIMKNIRNSNDGNDDTKKNRRYSTLCKRSFWKTPIFAPIQS